MNMKLFCPHLLHEFQNALKGVFSLPSATLLLKLATNLSHDLGLLLVALVLV